MSGIATIGGVGRFMGRLIYITSMFCFGYVLVEGDPFMGLLLMSFATRLLFILPAQKARAVVIPINRSGPCNCLTHRLVGRIKMAA